MARKPTLADQPDAFYQAQALVRCSLAADYLAGLRYLERRAQAQLDAIRELIQDELLARLKAGTITLGGREVTTSATPDAGREAEIARMTGQVGQARMTTVIPAGLGAGLLLAIAVLVSTWLAMPMPPIPRCEMPAVVAPTAVMGNQRVTVRWYKGDQVTGWANSVQAELFSVAGADVTPNPHATERHSVEAVIARIVAQELCPPEFWQRPPCDDGRYRFLATVPESVSFLGGEYVGRLAVVVIDASTMGEVTSFLAGRGREAENYARGVEEHCRGGGMQAAYGRPYGREEQGIG